MAIFFLILDVKELWVRILPSAYRRGGPVAGYVADGTQRSQASNLAFSVGFIVRTLLIALVNGLEFMVAYITIGYNSRHSHCLE